MKEESKEKASLTFKVSKSRRRQSNLQKRKKIINKKNQTLLTSKGIQVQTKAEIQALKSENYRLSFHCLQPFNLLKKPKKKNGTLVMFPIYKETHKSHNLLFLYTL